MSQLGSIGRQQVKQLSTIGVRAVDEDPVGGLNGALVPAVVGGLGPHALFDGSRLLSGERCTSLRLLSSHAEADGMLWLRYEVLPERPAGRGAESRAAAANSSRLTALDGE